MGRIAAAGADLAFVTSDNPRTEDPEAIVRDTIAGLEPGNWEVIVDRRKAISRALQAAGPDDVLLLAGKGHETYQEIEGERLPFDEIQVVAELLARRETAG
jgi:UDP-N-acetylmuramoyl-L-alanyl-D-glutamate--2,6-diaminopimelate ligase